VFPRRTRHKLYAPAQREIMSMMSIMSKKHTIFAHPRH
jgi:hypothetical protein